jgi:hypothetical protein
VGAAFASVLGICHSWKFTMSDTTFALVPAWHHTLGYLAMAAVLGVARWITVDSEGHG